MVFNNAVGLACAGCSLYSYQAGSTTPQPTYTDATGTSQNTNPIILGADGGPLTPSGSSGAIWMGLNSYKFVLIDASGNTVFTVDNVSGGGGIFPCGPANSIQIANTAVTGLSCDATITINPSAHTINVGTLTTAHVTIGANGTPTTWTFDTTTPATALASLGAGSIGSGTVNQIAIYPASGSVIGGSSVLPAGITVATQTPSDNSTNPASTAYVAAPGAINPLSLKLATGTAMTGNQGTGTLVQHSSGTAASGNFAKFDANGNTVDSGIAAGANVAQSANLTGSRVAGTVYQNTTAQLMFVSGNMTTGGSSTGSVACLNGPAATPVYTVYFNESTASVSGAAAGFVCMVPPGFYYKIVVSGTVGSTPASWYETTF